MNTKSTILIVAATVISFVQSKNTHAQTVRTRDDMVRLEREALALIESEMHGGKHERENSNFAFTTPDGTYHELAYMLDGVPIYRKTTNLREADIIRAAGARTNLGLSGRGVDIGLWDSGRAHAHPEFRDRLTVARQDGAFTSSSHATHVAGTLAASGIDREATGLAPEARLSSFDSRFDHTEMWSEAQKGLRVSNHSYALQAGWERVYRDGAFEWSYRTFGPGFGEYGVHSWLWDDVMWQNPHYLAVKAAGNEAGQGPPQSQPGHLHDGFTDQRFTDRHEADCASGFGCLGSLSTSKNALVVGALDVDGKRVADFSSRGPTLDGRIKPDVVSTGTGVYSTYGADSYGTSSGTSMAAPTVAGSVALMVELERRLLGAASPLLSSTIKGLLIHGADDLGNPGPDYLYGWGRVNVKSALDLMLQSTGSSVAILEPEVHDGMALDFYSSGADLKVTLSWIDPKGPNPNTVVDKSQPVLVEDIDIVVEKDGETYYPYILDPLRPESPAGTGVNSIDNVEQVHVGRLPAGPVRVVLRRKGASENPLKVSLVVSGIQSGSPVSNSEEGPHQKAESIVVYPNPVQAGSEVRVVARHLDLQEIQFDLFDALGRPAKKLGRETAGLEETRLNIPSEVPAGLYFIRGRGEDMRFITPIAIIR